MHTAAVRLSMLLITSFLLRFITVFYKVRRRDTCSALGGCPEAMYAVPGAAMTPSRRLPASHLARREAL